MHQDIPKREKFANGGGAINHEESKRDEVEIASIIRQNFCPQHDEPAPEPA
jgi:hypothetical protein